MNNSIYNYSIRIIHSDTLKTSRIVVYDEKRAILIFEVNENRKNKIGCIHINETGSDIWIEHQNTLLDLISALYIQSKARDEEVDIKITPDLIGNIAVAKLTQRIFDPNELYNPNK